MHSAVVHKTALAAVHTLLIIYLRALYIVPNSLDSQIWVSAHEKWDESLSHIWEFEIKGITSLLMIKGHYQNWW